MQLVRELPADGASILDAIDARSHTMGCTSGCGTMESDDGPSGCDISWQSARNIEKGKFCILGALFVSTPYLVKKRPQNRGRKSKLDLQKQLAKPTFLVLRYFPRRGLAP